MQETIVTDDHDQIAVMVRCGRRGPTLRIAGCERLFDQDVDGMWASDHFGVTADLVSPTGYDASVRAAP